MGARQTIVPIRVREMSEVGAMAVHTEPNAEPINEVDDSRRKFLTYATGATAVVGAALAAVPFVESWNPSERARALGAPVEVDLSKVEVGQLITPIWRTQVIYVVRRPADLVAKLAQNDDRLKDPDSNDSSQPAYARNPMRSRTRRISGDYRLLHAPRLPAEAVFRAGRHPRRRLAGRLPLPLPWLALRSGRAGIQRLAGPDQPRRSSLQLSQCHYAGHRLGERHSTGSRLMADVSDREYGHDRGIEVAKGGFWGWLNKRFPAEQFMRSQALEYFAPKNFNFWYFFGFIARAGAGDAAAHRHLPDDVLQAGRARRRSTRSNTSCARSTSAG